MREIKGKLIYKILCNLPDLSPLPISLLFECGKLTILGHVRFWSGTLPSLDVDGKEGNTN